ncbi:hypothetical protein RND71_031046 [Anisodus tanguticus]|uniref:Uncharacterized protein n=1 Tax=Anisodus tanguticus TaxID=243964 RepID=A0AAE1RHJ1_9SOLA|nr:hypothetical protein RND71_031046 [Anisodus tanguticus]
MVSNPPPSSSNPSQQAPISTTNAVIPTNWITVTGKNKKNKKQNQKPPTKPPGTVIPATGTVIPKPRAIGNTAQVSETVFPPKNDLPKISDAGNPTGILGGAGNPTGTLGGAGNLPETLPATTLAPGLHPTETLPAANEAAAVTIGKGMVSNPPPSSSNPSQQAPISTTNAVIPTNWITVTGKNKKNKKQNQKPPTKPSGTVIPATGTVIPKPRAIGNTVKVSETVFPPKNDLPKISDAGNPTGILGGAGNPTGNPIGTLGGAGNLPETLPATTPAPGHHPPETLPAANEADGDKVEEEEMEVEEKELGEDASVDQPGQIVVQEKEPSPIAIEAFFERVATAKATEVEIGKGKASIPTPSSSNPSQQNPIPTTNALIHAPSNNWTTVTRKNKKNKNQNPKPPSKVTGTRFAIGTVDSEPKAIGNTVQVSESIFRPKNTPPKISDAGNPTGILGGAGNPTGTLGDGDKVEEEEMEVEEKELGEDASVDQPGQIVVQEKEPSPIAIEAFFERVRAISAKKKKMFEWRCAREKEKARERNPYRIPGDHSKKQEKQESKPKTTLKSHWNSNSGDWNSDSGA